MLITAPHKIAAHVNLLAARGCVADAERLRLQGLAQGYIDDATAQRLQAEILRFTPARLPPGNQVFGIFQDSVISTLHFQPITERAYAREAFRQAVRWIEVETSSQCNRRCVYCPNSAAPHRRSDNDFLDFALFQRTVGELAEIAYDGTMSFVGNNEFFLHRENRRYVDAARASLPHAVLKLYSNGDHMTGDDLAWAAQASVGLIHVTLHIAPGKEYDDAEALRRAFIFQRQIGTRLQLLDYVKGTHLQFGTRLGRTTVFVKAQNMRQLGHNWNGLVPDAAGTRVARTADDPCSYPLRQFIVSHDADVLMCCMAFKERTPENAESGMLVGNLATGGSSFLAYTSPAMVALRRAIFSTARKSGPCGTCPGFDPVEVQAAPLADYIAQRLAQWPQAA